MNINALNDKITVELRDYYISLYSHNMVISVPLSTKSSQFEGLLKHGKVQVKNSVGDPVCRF
jgi:hypothetical protein